MRPWQCWSAATFRWKSTKAIGCRTAPLPYKNILLAAHGLGLGAVWTGIYPLEDRISGASKMFQLPEQVIPLALIVIGQPAAQPASKSRYNPERVHKETW